MSVSAAAVAPAVQRLAGDVAVRVVATAAERRAFIDLPYRAYRDLPAWRAPLRLERKAQISQKHNPALARMEHALMLAWRGSQVVGRISAMVNPAHLAVHDDATGHFGFLDTLAPDPAAVAALMRAAEGWLGARGMARIAGPFNFSVNEECGLLIEGFDSPPMLMMPHGRPDYAEALDAIGYGKVIDLYAFLHDFDEIYSAPEKVQKWKAAFSRDPALTVRPLDMKNFRADIALVMDIFNDAWSRNWGFVPFSADQISAMAQELRPLIRADALWIASIQGEPAGFTLLLPDLNELTQGLDGRLLPFGWARLLWGLKLRGARRARLPLAGLRRKFHKTRQGMLAMTGSCESAFAAQHARGIRQIEASWILETNRDLLNLVALYDMARYKTYRIFEKAL